jgi:hypothetical protein
MCESSQKTRIRYQISCSFVYYFTAMLWFSGTTKQSVVLNSRAFIDGTKYIPAQVSGHLRFKDRCLPCATNILVITRRGRRVAQAALELCGSSERLGLMTLISSMSLNAERVACRTLTPWKSRQHKRRFQRSYRQARGKRLPAARHKTTRAKKVGLYAPSRTRLHRDWQSNVDPLA